MWPGRRLAAYRACVDLTGTWQAAPADEELRRTFHHAGYDDASWQPVPVPGHWADHAAFDQERSMLFRRAFEHALPADDGGRSWLELDGVCYQGDVWLDGQYLGDTEGYFIRHAFDVTELLKDRSEHELALEVNCSPAGTDGKRRSLLGVFEGGNDMVPHRNPGGIWAPVRLRHTGPVRIHGVRAICVEADHARAVIAVRASLVSGSARVVSAGPIDGYGLLASALDLSTSDDVVLTFDTAPDSVVLAGDNVRVEVPDDDYLVSATAKGAVDSTVVSDDDASSRLVLDAGGDLVLSLVEDR